MSASSSSLSEPPRSLARCRHFGSCGGCSLQDLSYEAQLERKRDFVLKSLAGLEGLPPLDVRGAPAIWNYRNKMEFSFGDVYPPVPGQWLKLGLKPKGRWHQILDLQECHLPSPEVAALLAAVRYWAASEK